MTTQAPLRVGLKYCGHCQPFRNMVDLMDQVRAAAPDIDFVRWSDPDLDVLLALQACVVACADIPPVGAPLVEVVVSSIDFHEYESDADLVAGTIEHLRKAGGAQ